MAKLVVRGVSAAIVRALEQRAALHERSLEHEHREILRAALGGPKRLHLADVLAAIPNVGHDEDFIRRQADGRS